MICSSIRTPKAPEPITPAVPNPLLNPSSLFCSHRRNPNITNKPRIPKRPHRINPIVITPLHAPLRYSSNGKRGMEENKGFPKVGVGQMLGLCGFGYWVQGFRCFPWMALNFHMAHNLDVPPSTLQLVQTAANLPMVAKPLYGILSDALYIGGAHRIPYISTGVILQAISWGLLALIPAARTALPALLACVLLSNLGASITEVAKDALTAEYGQIHNISGLQSYAFMASAAGGILGSFLGSIFLLKARPKTMFLTFAGLLSLQLALSLGTREVSLGLPENQSFMKNSILEITRKQFSNLIVAIRDESIFRPLIWIVTSISMVPILSGSIFCYQTQCLNLNPSIIGMSRVVSQLLLLSTTLLYDRLWNKIPMRKLMGTVQILYASSFLLDFILVKQINLRLGVSNKVFALCFSGIAETLSQFKVLPFAVLFASLSPSGSEGSLTSFFASALCVSSIASGFLGIGLADLIGISSGNYSRLPVGILIQAVAALVPLAWISHVPMSKALAGKVRKKGMSKRARRTRRVGRVVYDLVYAYRREREFDAPD